MIFTVAFAGRLGGVLMDIRLNRRTLLKLGLGGALSGLIPGDTSADAALGQSARIDRKALVGRHNVRRTSSNPRSPLQVGNGKFAFGADITGLQTFVPFNTLSAWGWHYAPLPTGTAVAEFKGTMVDTHGRMVRYPIPNPDQPELSHWLYSNPNRINLGRIGLRLLKADAAEASEADLTDCVQTLDLWHGTLNSQFTLDGHPVQVQTGCHPVLDAVVVRIVSPLVDSGKLTAFLDFPMDDGTEFTDYVGSYDNSDSHQTDATVKNSRRVDITHTQDDSRYYTSINLDSDGTVILPESSSNQALTITSASYGSGALVTDVTGLLQKAQVGNSLSIAVTNDTMGGDPALHQVKSLHVTYTLGTETHQADVAENGQLTLPDGSGRHRYQIVGKGSALAFICAFSPKPLPSVLPTVEESLTAASEHWPAFWNAGGAIDFSGSTDPRWQELERRVVLSQYLMAVNEAADLPPQESGLVNNGWHGKFHMEMYLWHAAHYALWNRWPLLNRSTGVYDRFLHSSEERAKSEDVRGARWPKMTSPAGQESAHPCNALLIWQQPHPMFFAELDYRAHPTASTLEKWREILFQTADFLSSFAYWDEATKRYIVGPPIYVVSENTEPTVTTNPTFELSYWRFGLRIAQTWRKRLGLPPNPEWERVLTGLAPLPVQDGCYVLYEGIEDMWTKFNFEHPALIGVYGLLPGDGVDVPTARRTMDQVSKTWNFEHTWGWDFPMLAMCAAKLGEQQQAVDFLLHPSSGFQFDDAGYATGGPFPYFPANGGLLYAVALMAAGWDNCPAASAPGFPGDTWKIRSEGLVKAI